MADQPLNVDILETALTSGQAGSLSRVDYGPIVLPSGRLIVVDPGTHGRDVSPVAVPPGTHTVHVLLNARTWAYAAIVLGEVAPVVWQHLCSVPVDTGTACFMSAEASERFLAWRPPGDLTKELWDPFYKSMPKPFHLRIDEQP